MTDRFERQRQFLGDQGQEKLRETSVGVVGAGGLGAFVVLELAYLGVGRLVLVDRDELDITNRNRLVGAWESHEDGTPKADILAELAHAIDSSIKVEMVRERFPAEQAREALDGVDVVMGCVDRDGPRFLLNEFCCERGLPLIDAASDTIPAEGGIYYGGRVCVSTRQTGCLHCFGVLDQDEMREDLATEAQRQDKEAIYGVEAGALGGGGPSVVTVNGVVASLAATEFLVLVTSIGVPSPYIDYVGHDRAIRKVIDREPGCYYCSLRPAE